MATELVRYSSLDPVRKPSPQGHLYCALAPVDVEIERRLGPDLLRDPRGQEVSANYDAGATLGGYGLADHGDGPSQPLEAIVALVGVRPVARLLATLNSVSLDPQAPFLTCALTWGARFHAALYSIADGPQFSIGTHARVLRALTDYMTAAQIVFLRGSIHARKNILVGGGTNTARKTLLNTMIAEIPVEERLAVIGPTSGGKATLLGAMVVATTGSPGTRVGWLDRDYSSFVLAHALGARYIELATDNSSPRCPFEYLDHESGVAWLFDWRLVKLFTRRQIFLDEMQGRSHRRARAGEVISLYQEALADAWALPFDMAQEDREFIELCDEINAAIAINHPDWRPLGGK